MKKGRGSHFDPQLLDCFFDNQIAILKVKEEWEEKEVYQLDNLISDAP